MESPPFESSPPAGFPLAISVFSSSISLIASISRPIRMFSPNSLCPLLGFLARSNPSNRRAIALLNAFEFFAFEARFEFPPLRAVLLLGYLHPLLPARWKSPARKYRRRRGNGGADGRPARQEDSNAEEKVIAKHQRAKGEEEKNYQ